jgi:hypothetical protein
MLNNDLAILLTEQVIHGVLLLGRSFGKPLFRWRLRNPQQNTKDTHHRAWISRILKLTRWVTNGMSGHGYKGLTEALPRPPQQAFFSAFHWAISCFYSIRLKNVWSTFLNNMSRVNSKHHLLTQENTDFYSFSPTVRPLTKSNTHLNTCLRAYRCYHNSLCWLKYLTMPRTWNFNHTSVFQLRNYPEGFLTIFGYF